MTPPLASHCVTMPPPTLLFIALISFQVVFAQTDETLQSVAAALPKFVDELPKMPTIKGYVLRGPHAEPAQLRIGMYDTTWKFHRDLNATRVFAYGVSPKTATVPGPTIEALQGVETYVTWENHLPSDHILPWDPTLVVAKPNDGGVPTVVHLHGGVVEPDSDGHPTSWFTADYRETGETWKGSVYHYMNRQSPGNLWYHDHAMGLTRVNLLAGLLGCYVIRSPRLENPLRLPAGKEYDRHLVVFDRSFRADGSIYINSTGNNPSIHPQWQPEYFGYAIIVNGKAWPYMRVHRRKYRFRILNASNARFFNFSLSNGLSFVFIGSDSVYLRKPVAVTSFLLSPSEFADVIINFANSRTHSALLKNSAPYPFPDGDSPDNLTSYVMEFLVDRAPATMDRSLVPLNLLKYPPPIGSRPVMTRYITMFEYASATEEPTHLFLNGVPFGAPVTERPREGTDEIWQVINLTEDNHPLHIHLALASPLWRRKLTDADAFRQCMLKVNDAEKCNFKDYLGEQSAFPLEERWWKNVLKIGPGHVTTVLVRFSPLESPGGRYPFEVRGETGYVYHCHILDHEDNEMMRPMVILRADGNRS